MKVINSFPLNLLAGQELSTAILPTLDDYFVIWKNGQLLGYKIQGHTLAQLTAEEAGSGANLPERRYLIDTDMPSGSSYEVNGDGNGQINDPYLDGKVYDVHRNGLLISKGYIWQNDVVGGGIRLLQPNDTFELGEEVVISFQPAFSPYIPTPDAIARFSNGEQVITATGVISAGMFRKLIILRSSTNTLMVTLPAASAYPANVMLAIMSDGGLHKQATLRCAGSDKVFFNGVGWADFWLRQNQQIILIPTATGWRVVNFSGSDHFNRLGTTDIGDITGPNQWNAALNPGPQLRSVYPGTWDYIQRLKAAQPAAVVSGAAWATSPWMWGEGDGITTFNFPVKAGYFPRYLDPDGSIDEDRAALGQGNLPNSTQLQQLAEHDHAYEGPKLKANSDSGGSPDAVDVEAKRTVDLQLGVGVPGTTGAENRPVNIGGLPLINI